MTDNKIVKLFKNALERQSSATNPSEILNIFPDYKEFDGGIFYIDDCYNPPGIGMVVTGINRGKSIVPGDMVFMGPFGKQFYEIRVKSLHNNMRQIVPILNDHNRGCVAFAPTKKVEIKRDQITRGTILVTSALLTKNVCYRFKAVITLFTKSITLKSGYAPIIHLFTIRQSARMIIDPRENFGNEIICFEGLSPSVAIVTFKFKVSPEYVEPYNVFVLRSGDIHGAGIVVSTLSIEDDDDAKPDPVKYKRGGKRRQQAKNNKIKV
jgi:GTPase